MKSEGPWESLSSSLLAFAQKTLKNLPLARSHFRLAKKFEVDLKASLSSSMCSSRAGVTQCSPRITLRAVRLQDLHKSHMTIMRSQHGNSIAEWWKSFKKDVLRVLKTTKQKGSLCTAAPSPNRLQKDRLVIFYSLGNRGYSLFSLDHNAVKYDVQKRKDTSIIVIVLEKGRGLFLEGLIFGCIKSRIVFGFVTSHYVSHTKNKYAKAKFSGQSTAS